MIYHRLGNVRPRYLKTIKLIERLHRQFLEVIKIELERHKLNDISNIQSLIIMNIAHEELTVGELTHRGYYLGSNVSYNMMKLVENGYILHKRSKNDKRSFKIKLTEKGLHHFRLMNEMINFHINDILEHDIVKDELESLNSSLEKLDGFWTELIRFSLHR